MSSFSSTKTVYGVPRGPNRATEFGFAPVKQRHSTAVTRCSRNDNNNLHSSYIDVKSVRVSVSVLVSVFKFLHFNVSCVFNFLSYLFVLIKGHRNILDVAS